MRVRVDADVCQGHTLCSLAAPTVFLLRDEDGHAYVTDDEVLPGLEESVAKAALTCPEGAIVIDG